MHAKQVQDIADIARHWAMSARPELAEELVDHQSENLVMATRQATIELAEAMTLAAGVYHPKQLAVRKHTKTLREIQRDPARTFAGLLHLYPRPELAEAPSDYLSHAPRTAAETRWHRVLSLAVSTKEELRGAGEQMGPGEKWRVLEDSAALASMVAIADEHAGMIDGGSRGRDHYGPSKALRYTAQQVQQLASLPGDRGREASVSPATRPVRVNSPASLLEGQRRLETFIREDPASPTNVAFFAAAQETVLQRLSELTPSTPSWVDQTRERLRGLKISELNTLRPEAAPPRATGQLMSMVQYLRAAPAAELVPIANASMAAAAAAITATAARTHQELSGKDWVISHGRATETNELLWQPTREPHDPPRLATALDEASAIARPHAETPPAPERTRAAALLEDVQALQTQRPVSPGEQPEDDTAARLKRLQAKLADERNPPHTREEPTPPSQGPTQGM